MVIHALKIINNDIQSTFRAVYYPSKVLSELSYLPKVVKGKIVGGKPSTVVVLKKLLSGKALKNQNIETIQESEN